MTNDLARAFWRDGYLTLDNFFPQELMLACRDVVSGASAPAPAWEPVASPALASDMQTSIPPLESLDGPLAAVHRDEQLRDLTASILGEDFADLYLLLMTFAPGGQGGAWHQDCDPGPDKPYCLNRLAYCQEIDEGTGGQLVVVPGSHRAGRLPVGDPHEPLPDERVINPSPGTLVIMHCMLFHRITKILSSAPRLSINFRAGPSGTTGLVNDIAVYRNVVMQFTTRRMEHRE